MPDIKTALEQALSKAQTRAQLPAEWDDEGGAAVIESVTTQAKEATMQRKYFETTNNVTRATFDYIVKNPGKNRKEILTTLEAQGYKQGSTSSLIGQFTKQGHIIKRGDFYFAQHTEYVPLKTALRKAAQKPAPKAKATPRPKFIPPTEAAGIAALPTGLHTASVAVAPQINSAWDAETLLNHLSIKQARALYDELRKIFGG